MGTHARVGFASNFQAKPIRKGRCSTSGKIRWETKADAEIALADIERVGKGRGRSYLCPVCESWHVTSQK